MTAIAHQPHSVTRALAGARDQLHAVAEVPVWSMDAAETTAAIGELSALAAQVAELQARVLRHADRTELATNAGATSTLGRKQRYATEAQRIAKTIEAGGCEVEGCDAPPGMTHLHHLVRWADGGKTNLDTMIMICPCHHTRAHDTRYQMTRLPTGKIAFHRRT